jgi:hypothetical protein
MFFECDSLKEAEAELKGRREAWEKNLPFCPAYGGSCTTTCVCFNAGEIEEGAEYEPFMEGSSTKVKVKGFRMSFPRCDNASLHGEM